MSEINTTVLEVSALKRFEKDFRQYAGGEACRAEQLGSTIYVWTTEIGALRLFHRYAMMGNPKQKFRVSTPDENRPEWFFSIDI